jgi:predicted transcriptional regulator
MKRLREHRIVFHGLRKNAVIMLLEVGCTEDEVGAIVGMSPAMVRHYAKEVRRHHLAINAMKKLETGWSAIRKNVLGSVKTG